MPAENFSSAGFLFLGERIDKKILYAVFALTFLFVTAAEISTGLTVAGTAPF